MYRADARLCTIPLSTCAERKRTPTSACLRDQRVEDVGPGGGSSIRSRMMRVACNSDVCRLGSLKIPPIIAPAGRHRLKISEYDYIFANLKLLRNVDDFSPQISQHCTHQFFRSDWRNGSALDF